MKMKSYKPLRNQFTTIFLYVKRPSQNPPQPKEFARMNIGKQGSE